MQAMLTFSSMTLKKLATWGFESQVAQNIKSSIVFLK
jgi:hypothetical protein